MQASKEWGESRRRSRPPYPPCVGQSTGLIHAARRPRPKRTQAACLTEGQYKGLYAVGHASNKADRERAVSMALVLAAAVVGGPWDVGSSRGRPA